MNNQALNDIASIVFGALVILIVVIMLLLTVWQMLGPDIMSMVKDIKSMLTKQTKDE